MSQWQRETVSLPPFYFSRDLTFCRDVFGFASNNSVCICLASIWLCHLCLHAFVLLIIWRWYKTIIIFGESRFFTVSVLTKRKCENMCDLLSQYNKHTHTHKSAIDCIGPSAGWNTMSIVCGRLLNFWTSLIFSLDSLVASVFFSLSLVFFAFVYVIIIHICICFCERVCSSCFHAIHLFQCLFYLDIFVDHLYLGF